MVAPPTRATGSSGLGVTRYWRSIPTAYPTSVKVSAVMPFGWFSRKSSAIPPANPANAPEDGPSRNARMTVTM